MKTVVSAANKTNNLPATVTQIITKMEPNASMDNTATSTQPLQFPVPDATTTTSANMALNNKRPISLNLNKPTQAKKPRLVAPSSLILESPDLQNMKTLNTPDVEKMILSSAMQTPQPGTVFPTKVGPVTVEQEAFGKGFEEALHSLHTSKNLQAQLNNNTANPATVAAAVSTTTTTSVTGMSGGSFTYTNLESSFPVSIKDEPQNPPASPPVSPIDMETQEKIKLERKRQRNRVAASKCRKRKLERISKLEDKVKSLKGENNDLGAVVKNLKDHVAQLKEQVMEHFSAGCNLPTILSGATILTK